MPWSAPARHSERAAVSGNTWYANGWVSEKDASDVVPDWICEVLSPTGVHSDRVTKMQLYARHGVPSYWLVDPAGTLEALTLERGRWVVSGTYDRTSIARIPPFETTEQVVGDLFMPEASPLQRFVGSAAEGGELGARDGSATSCKEGPGARCGGALAQPGAKTRLP